MRDADVRQAVRGNLLKPFYEDGESRILDEMVLGLDEARIDLAVINGHLHGYELKSAADTLDRLPRQAEVYGRALDFVTLVVAESHIVAATAIIPQWWGIVRAKKRRGRTYLKICRPALQNPSLDALTVARFLWRQEAESFLADRGVTGLSRKPKRELWQLIADHYQISEINSYVRQTLKARSGWRAAP